MWFKSPLKRWREKREAAELLRLNSVIYQQAALRQQQTAALKQLAIQASQQSTKPIQFSPSLYQLSGGGWSYSRQIVEMPTVKTLSDSFKGQLKISEAQASDPKMLELLQHLGELFQQAIQHPEKVGRFQTLWRKIEDAPRVDGFIQIDQNITSEITIDKIEKW